MRTFNSIQKSTEKSTRYRSVKYKVARDTSVSSCFESVEKKPKIINLPSTAKYSYSRNRRNISEFGNGNMTQTNLCSSVLNGQSFNDLKMRKTSYMQSFDFLLKMQKNRYNKKEKQKQRRQQMGKNSVDLSTTFLRVDLPVLNEVQSNFTVLDNINLPIEYINEEIIRIKNDMKVQEESVAKIGKKMKQVEKKIVQKIEQTQKMALKQFERLRGLLKTNRVTQQQANLKIKQSFLQCEDYLPGFCHTLQESKDRCLNLQEQIFKNHPFQLKQSQEFQILTGNYF